MKRISLVFILILLFSIVNLSPISTQETLAIPQYVYYIDVFNNGSALVRITFTANGNGSTFIYLPKFTSYTINFSGGRVFFYNLTSKVDYYFYKLIGLRYFSKGMFKATISYIFKYASLMVGYNAWFMSPLIGVANNSTVNVVVHVPNFSSFTETFPEIPKIRNDTLYFNSLEKAATVEGYSIEEGARVSFNYRLKRPIEEEVVNRTLPYGVKLTFHIPIYYKEIIDKIYRILNESYPYYKHIFGEYSSELEFRFYLPETIDLSVYGYVKGEIISLRKNGPIYINMALIRFAPGILEQTVLHEYVHVALGKIGVVANSNLRWVHEGLAEYISLNIMEKLGYNMSYQWNARLSLVSSFLKKYGTYGAVSHWVSGPDEPLFYSAALKVIKTIGDKYGGLDFYRRVFIVVKKMGGITTTNQFIEACAKVGGQSIYDTFSELGFSVRKPIDVLVYFVYFILIIISIIMLVRIYFKREVEKLKRYYELKPQ